MGQENAVARTAAEVVAYAAVRWKRLRGEARSIELDAEHSLLRALAVYEKGKLPHVCDPELGITEQILQLPADDQLRLAHWVRRILLPRLGVEE